MAAAKAAQYPGNVIHLRREQGRPGKAHTLNYGLAIILGDEWMEALLITDADVIFTPDSLRKMTRHLADPQVGAVTAYIKEGSRPGNYLTRFIGYEYITAQAAARRGQNVLGAIACLALAARNCTPGQTCSPWAAGSIPPPSPKTPSPRSRPS